MTQVDAPSRAREVPRTGPDPGCGHRVLEVWQPDAEDPDLLVAMCFECRGLLVVGCEGGDWLPLLVLWDPPR